jgi:hypothetical protein
MLTLTTLHPFSVTVKSHVQNVKLSLVLLAFALSYNMPGTAKAECRKEKRNAATNV